MPGINKAIIVGRVGKDPEIRTTQDGGKIANLSVATSEVWNQGGERKERTEWHRVVIFNDRISDVVEKYVAKGSLIGITGSIQTRKWTDQSGQDRYSTEIVVGKFNGELHLLGDGNRGEGGQSSQRNAVGATNRGKTQGGELDDEIPF